MPILRDRLGRAAGRDDLEAEVVQHASRSRSRPACRRRRRVMNDRAARRELRRPPPPGPSRMPSGSRGAIPITSPVERISGPSSESAPAKRSNGSTTSFTHTWPLVVSARQVEIGEPLAEQHPAGELRDREPDRLGDERHRPRRARVGLDHVQAVLAADRELDVQQPDDPERARDPAPSARGSGRASRRRACAAAARRPSRRSGCPPPRRAA